ncbi:hypothetical protein J7E62_28280 [Variovorax paradoxus]|nr:hypothetical protein [Variovorax paradoxus]
MTGYCSRMHECPVMAADSTGRCDELIEHSSGVWKLSVFLDLSPPPSDGTFTATGMRGCLAQEAVAVAQTFALRGDKMPQKYSNINCEN